MLQLLVAVFIVLLSSALCSGTEAALFSVPVNRARQLAQANTSAARALWLIRQNMSRPIATVVILNNVANIVGSIVVGGIATVVLGDHWLGLFSGLLTFLVIIFAEIVPKTLGERYAERVSLAAARPVLGLTYLLTPLVWLIERITSPVTRGKTIPTVTEAEIKLLASIGRQQGVIGVDEFDMLQRVFRLNDVMAEDLMTPRVAMTYLRGHLTLTEAQESIIHSPHSRIVITGDSVDDVLGVVLKDELLAALIQQQGDLLLASLARPVRFAPETVRADRLLQIFRQSRQHLVVVIDEFGGVAGVVTLEDVLETLTGEIVDETDLFVDLQEEARRQRGIPG